MRKLAFLLAALLLWPLPGWAQSEARLRWTLPERAGLGQPFVLEVRTNRDLGPLTLTWQGRDYKLMARQGTYRTLLGTGLDESLAGQSLPVELRFSFEGQQRSISRRVTISSWDYPSESLTVAPSMAQPPQSALDCIARERKASQAALSSLSPAEALRLPMRSPLLQITVTSSFGKRRTFNGVTRSRHSGLDLRAATGTPVRALASGRVVLTGDFYYSGKCVYLDHGAGLVSAYFHLSEIKVQEGEQVQGGQVLALSGQSGRVTGPHLHLGLSQGGQAMDPGPAVGAGSFPSGLELLYRLDDPEDPAAAVRDGLFPPGDH